MVEAKGYWDLHTQADDNPLRQRIRNVVMVRAVARGPRSSTTTKEGIHWLVGASMWEYFDSEAGLLGRLSEALGRNPLSYFRHQAEKAKVVQRVTDYLVNQGLVTPNGQVNWPALVASFP